MDLLTFNNKKCKKSLLQLCYTKCVLEYFREIRRKSNNMKTEDKSNSPRVRIAVLGKMNVGKSALTVRYLTRRYIGEYRSNTDLLYRQTMSINNNTSEVEIVDVCNSDTDNFPEEPVYWADACVVVYDVTSSSSLKYAADILHQIQQLRTQNQIPIVLLGNKADLEHLRETEEIEGRTIAVQHGCQFHEISVAENSEHIYQAFDSLISECRAVQATQKTRKFSVSKMIGTLIGTGNNGKTQQNHQNPAHQGGTVVVCQKSDLYKSRVLKRRQNFIATASL